MPKTSTPNSQAITEIKETKHTIKVVPLNGSNMLLDVSNSETTSQILERINIHTGYPLTSIRLIGFGARQNTGAVVELKDSDRPVQDASLKNLFYVLFKSEPFVATPPTIAAPPRPKP